MKGFASKLAVRVVKFVCFIVGAYGSMVLAGSVLTNGKPLKLIFFFSLNFSFRSAANKAGKDQCTPSRIVANHTLKGGKTAGEIKDLGMVESIEDCIEKCCDEKACEVAFLVDGKCHSVECYGDELCQSLPIEDEQISPTIVYMNIRNGARIKDKGKR